MKIWYSYGSEHSMNLVMIGQFKNVDDAEKAKEMIDTLTKAVNEDVESGLLELGNPPQRFNERLLEILKKANIFIIGAHEFEQFAYEFSVRVDGNKVVLRTEESDVSAFLKVLIHEGAKVEVYSAHNFPDSEYGRGK